MPIQHSIWLVAETPESLSPGEVKEQFLEDMIVANPRILLDQWMIIGRQVITSLGGRIDLLGITPDASLLVIELKRGKTPNDVVAQALGYASWVEQLTADQIAGIYSKFSKGGDLGGAFEKRFGHLLDEDSLNQAHQIIIIGSDLDATSERIVLYLSAKDIPVNVLFFQVFKYGNEQFLSRAWLKDPAETQINAAAGRGTNEPWNGEFYVSFGHGEARHWDEAVKFGFVCGGGGSWYSKTLQLLSPGDRIWVRVPAVGFVGVGRVVGQAELAKNFGIIQGEAEVPALDLLKGGHYHRDFRDDSEQSEYIVRVEWIQTLPLDKAFNEVGLFGNQNTVCKPTTTKWRHTVERLKTHFTSWDK